MRGGHWGSIGSISDGFIAAVSALVHDLFHFWGRSFFCYMLGEHFFEQTIFVFEFFFSISFVNQTHLRGPTFFEFFFVKAWF